MMLISIFLSRISQGLVDLDAEIAKCEKKIGLAQLNLEKVKKLISQPGYEQNIPEDVRAANLENVSCSMSQCSYQLLLMANRCSASNL